MAAIVLGSKRIGRGLFFMALKFAGILALYNNWGWRPAFIAFALIVLTAWDWERAPIVPAKGK